MTNKKTTTNEEIEIIMEDVKSLTTEEGYYAFSAMGYDEFPYSELASLPQAERVEFLKMIAHKLKNKAEEQWKNGAVIMRITKTEDGPKIEQEFIPPPNENEE